MSVYGGFFVHFVHNINFSVPKPSITIFCLLSSAVIEIRYLSSVLHQLFQKICGCNIRIADIP